MKWYGRSDVMSTHTRNDLLVITCLHYFQVHFGQVCPYTKQEMPRLCWAAVELCEFEDRTPVVVVAAFAFHRLGSGPFEGPATVKLSTFTRAFRFRVSCATTRNGSPVRFLSMPGKRDRSARSSWPHCYLRLAYGAEVERTCRRGSLESPSHFHDKVARACL